MALMCHKLCCATLGTWPIPSTDLCDDIGYDKSCGIGRDLHAQMAGRQGKSSAQEALRAALLSVAK